MIKRYYILQLPDSNRNLFRGYDNIAGRVKLSDYVPVYTNTIQVENDLATCEKLFELFNINHPDTFTGHSLSVSDIVVLLDESTKETKYYYCDYFGFVEVLNV